MFDKILGKKNKCLEVFNSVQKKYCQDQKKIEKMDRKDLMAEMDKMGKYIAIVCAKLQQGKNEYEKLSQKNDDMAAKLKEFNMERANMSNKYEELGVKFTNLQNSLQMIIKDKQIMLKNELQFLQSHQLCKQKITDMSIVLKCYRDQILLVEKIANQNKQLKDKYSQLQSEYYTLSEKIAEKQKVEEVDLLGIGKVTGKSIVQTEEDEDRYLQLKLVLQTKEQMITMLNKKINEEKEKASEIQDKLNALNDQLQRVQTEIKQKDEEIKRGQNDNSELKKKLNMLKEEQQKLKDFSQQQKLQIQKKNEENVKQKNEIIELKQKLKLSEEQKKIIKGDLNLKTQRSVQNQQLLRIQCEKLKHFTQSKDRQIENLTKKIQQLQQLVSSFQKSTIQLKTKQKQGEKIKEQLLQEKQKYQQLSKRLQNIQQSYEIRLKKLQFNANQQRIKADNLKRSLTNIQTKQQQNRKQLDDMYQKKMIQDAKYAKMQSKLKQYKKHIQYLQKEKVQLEKTFQDKMKVGRTDEIVVEPQFQDMRKNENSHRSSNNTTLEDEAVYKLNNKIVDLEEQIQFLKQENKVNVCMREELQQKNTQLEKNYKIMSSKREEVIKQINKLASKSNSAVEQTNGSTQRIQIGSKNRQKKIAEKALKGFDILSKLTNTLYKEFISVHLVDLNKKQIQNMESNINELVKKCEDMKDIFHGYL